MKDTKQRLCFGMEVGGAHTGCRKRENKTPVLKNTKEEVKESG